MSQIFQLFDNVREWFWKNKELRKTVRSLSISKIWLLSSSGPIMCVSVTLFSFVVFFVFDFEILWKMISDALERLLHISCTFSTRFNVTYARTAVYLRKSKCHVKLKERKKNTKKKCTALKDAKSQKMFHILSLLQKNERNLSFNFFYSNETSWRRMNLMILKISSVIQPSLCFTALCVWFVCTYLKKCNYLSLIHK